MSWGVFEIEGRPVQVVPCDEDGLADPSHLLHMDCVCRPTVEYTDGRSLIIHEDVL